MLRLDGVEAKNGEVQCLYDTEKNRCDKASSIKYLKRVGISFLGEGSGRTNFALRFIPREIYSFLCILKLDINDSVNVILFSILCCNHSFIWINIVYIFINYIYSVYFLVHFSKIQILY